MCIPKKGGNKLILLNNKEADLEHKRTYRSNIKFEFEGSAILLKLDKKRKAKKKFKNLFWI